jgi:hypothetical protein
VVAVSLYATIPKAKQGGTLDRSKYCYLNAIHMDIAFGDCVSIGGFQYALILVDRTTHYNWTFGLKDLSSDSIILALCLFCALAGSLAWFETLQFCGEQISYWWVFEGYRGTSYMSVGQLSSQITLESDGAHGTCSPHQETDALLFLVLRNYTGGATYESRPK